MGPHLNVSLIQLLICKPELELADKHGARLDQGQPRLVEVHVGLIFIIISLLP